MLRRTWGWAMGAVVAGVCGACAGPPVLGPEDFVEANRVVEEIVLADPASGRVRLLVDVRRSRLRRGR